MRSPFSMETNRIALRVRAKFEIRAKFEFRCQVLHERMCTVNTSIAPIATDSLDSFQAGRYLVGGSVVATGSAGSAPGQRGQC